MFSQDDDSQQRVALFMVFGLVAVVVASVLVFGARSVRHARSPAAVAVPAAVTAAVPASAPADAPAMPTPALSGSVQQDADAASVKVEQGLVKFYFASGKADLAAGAGDALTDVVKGAAQGRKLVISGFHDASGDPAKNAALARQRAVAVRDALKAAGVPESQIELKKPEQLEGTGSDAEARRVEISLL